MADVARAIVIKFKAEGSEKVQSDINKMSEASNRMNSVMGRALGGIRGIFGRARKDIDQSASGMESSIGRVAESANMLSRALAAIGLSLGTRELMSYADSYRNIHNRLSTVINDADAMKAASKTLFDIAQKTRASWAGTVDLFTKVSSVSAALGYSQADVLQFVETLNKAILVSGASAVEAEAALRQLSQGLASGTLRGDELNSVMEQMSYVAQRIAAGMGLKGGIGDLRKLGAEGEITARKLFEAFRKEMDRISEDAAKMKAPISAAFQTLQNSLTETIGRLSETSGATETAVNLIDLLTEHTEGLVRVFSVLGMSTLGILILNFLKLLTPVRLVLIAITALIALADKINMNKIVEEFNKVSEAAKKFFALIKRFLGIKADPLIQETERVKESFDKLVTTGVEVNLSKQVAYDFKKTKEEMVTLLDYGKAFGRTFMDLIAGKGWRIKSRVEEEVRARIDLTMKELESYKKGMGILAEKPEATAPDAKAVAKAKTGGGTAPPTFAQAIKDLERESILLKLNNDQRIIAEELYRTEDAIKRKLTQTEKERVTALVQANDEQSRLNDMLQEIKKPQEELSQKTNLINKLFADGKINVQEYTDALSKLVEKSNEVQNTFSGGFSDALTKLQEKTKEFGSGFSNWILDAFGKATDAIVDFAKTGTLTIDRFLSSIAESMLRFASEQLIAKAMTSMFGGFMNPIAGFAGGALPKFANGGSFTVGGSGGTDSRLVAFRATPGEKVDVTTPRQQQQNSSETNIRVVNVIDPKESLSALDTAAGEKIVMNMIQRNPAALRRILGAN